MSQDRTSTFPAPAKPIGSDSGEPFAGLSEEDAAARLAADGPNQLPQPDRRTLARIAIEILRDPIFALLLGAGFVYLMLGDLAEALVLLAFALVSVLIAVVQESRSERVLQALRDLTSPRALVIREGLRKRIAGREVVRGDIMVLAEGDRVPADAVLRINHDLHTDESLLTGESVPVRKVAVQGAPPTVRAGGDDLPLVFSGTLVVRGQGIAEVFATGAKSEIGKIGLALGTIEAGRRPLQAQTRKLVQTIAAIGFALGVLAAVLYGFYRGPWIDGVLSGIALSMSLLPQEYPLVLTVFMVMGAWRISRARVLTRRAAAIETLGAATVLCTDKTGTLTQNKMSVAELWSGDRALRLQDSPALDQAHHVHALIEFGILASAKEPFDPMERAFHDLGKLHLANSEHLHPDWNLVRAYGLRPDLLVTSQAWQAPPAADYVIAAKGAPEALADVCHLDAATTAAVRRHADEMAARGMRILGVAKAKFSGSALPESQHDFNFEFLGLVGLADPLRESVPEAVRDCRAAGITVVMITGDYAATAEFAAKQAGIDGRGTMTGDEIARASDAELKTRVAATSVFARVLPEQKLRLVNAFKANGEIVAMTGDGVNDAPSLRAAHIGIAMGSRGTDVAREAASIVLLDDDFGSIVHTIRLGRRIYDNLRKAMGYILAVHVPIAGLSLLPLIFGWPLILAPVHIAFLEMVIDPVCSIVFEAESEEDDVMRRRPRNPKSPLLSTALVVWGLIQGSLVLLLLAGILFAAVHMHMPEPEIRALVFTSLVVTNIGLIFVNRSFSASVAIALRRSNKALWRVLVVVAGVLGLALFWPPARALFRFGPLHADDLSLCLGAGIAILVILNFLKPIWRARLTA